MQLFLSRPRHIELITLFKMLYLRTFANLSIKTCLCNYVTKPWCCFIFLDLIVQLFDRNSKTQKISEEKFSKNSVSLNQSEKVQWRLNKNCLIIWLFNYPIIPLIGSGPPDKYSYEIGRRSQIIWPFIQ